jgi:hypothetical protein
MIRILPCALSVLFLGPLGYAQNATVSVLHGVPGLPQPVEVFANGNSLFSFDFGDLEGPLRVPAGVINLEVRLNGTPILRASPNLQADVNYTVVAHLREGGGNALTAFVNDLSRVEGIGQYFATVAFRHVADAPSVDLLVNRLGRESFVYGDVSNGEEGQGWEQAPAYLLSGPYDVRLTPAGSSRTAFGPVPVGAFASGDFYSIFAIGELGQSSFRLVVQTIETPPNLPDLQTFVRGTACGGRISFSTNNVQFDQPFDVNLTGGTPNGLGFLLVGFSNTQEPNLGLQLPFDLGVLGATGCTLYQDIAGLVEVNLDANGDARFLESIPAEIAGLIALEGVHFQYAFLSPGANALDLLFTEYASIETR